MRKDLKSHPSKKKAVDSIASGVGSLTIESAESANATTATDDHMSSAAATSESGADQYAESNDEAGRKGKRAVRGGRR